MSIFAEKLREEREIKKLSQQRLAEILVTKQQTVSKWEKGILEPSYDNLLLISKILDVSIDYLLGNTPL